METGTVRVFVRVFYVHGVYYWRLYLYLPIAPFRGFSLCGYPLDRVIYHARIIEYMSNSLFVSKSEHSRIAKATTLYWYIKYRQSMVSIISVMAMISLSVHGINA